MMVSTRGRYALRVMIDLAQNKDDGFISINAISKRQEISLKYLESIVSDLFKAGLVKSQRGKSGGYVLTHMPSEYNLFQIVSAAEKSITLVSCDEMSGDGCRRANECLTLPLWSNLDKLFEHYMSSISLQMLIDREIPAFQPDAK